jgi:hypothetical protein
VYLIWQPPHRLVLQEHVTDGPHQQIRVLDPMATQIHTIFDHHQTYTVHDFTYSPNGGFEDDVMALPNQVWASVVTKCVVGLWHDEIQMPEHLEPTKLS